MKLQDVCHFIVDCPHSTAPDEGYGIPLIRTPNIGLGRFKLEGVHRVSEKVYLERCRRAMPQNDDIILAREAPAGNAAIIKNNEKMCLGQRTVLIRPNSEKVCPDYLVYYLLAPEQQYKLLGTANGATVAHVNLPTIREMNIDNLPLIEVQRKIADILSAYDDLIENNRKQIKLLEEAAQRLYKEWFIDLRFLGHETTPIIDGIPEGWVTGKAIDFFSITIGKTPPRAENQSFTDGNNGTPWVSISDMGSSGVYIFFTTEGLTADSINKYNVKKVPIGTILLSFKLTLGRVSIVTTPCCTNEAIAHFYIDEEWMREYTYLYLKNFEYDTLGNTSSISKAVNSSIIKAMPFILPNTDLVSAFSKLTVPIFKKIYDAQKNINAAQSARDKLLPQLMTGELEVNA